MSSLDMQSVTLRGEQGSQRAQRVISGCGGEVCFGCAFTEGFLPGSVRRARSRV